MLAINFRAEQILIIIRTRFQSLAISFGRTVKRMCESLVSELNSNWNKMASDCASENLSKGNIHLPNELSIEALN